MVPNPPLPSTIPSLKNSGRTYPEVNPFSNFGDMLCSLLKNITSRCMHTVSLRLAPALKLETTRAVSASGDMSDSISGAFTYRCTREGAIGLLFSDDAQSAFQAQPLAGLALLHISLQENSLEYDGNWWCEELRGRLGCAPHEIRTHVDYCK